MSRVIPFPALAAVPDDCCFDSCPVPLREALAAARRSHRRLIVAAGQWALTQGVSLPADHVALWAAAADYDGRFGDTDGLTGPWRASGLIDFLATIAGWCAMAGCPTPANLAESLWHLYGFLAATGRLHPGSDELVELRAALVVFGRSDGFRPTPPLSPSPRAA